MTRTDVFLDTNVVVYAMVGDTLLADRSWTILRAGGTVSVQVLNECANTLRRKFSFDWPDVAEAAAQLHELCDIVPLTEEIHVRGLALAERYSLSVYDGMIVAAAQLAGLHRPVHRGHARRSRHRSAHDPQSLRCRRLSLRRPDADLDHVEAGPVGDWCLAISASARAYSTGITFLNLVCQAVQFSRMVLALAELV